MRDGLIYIHGKGGGAAEAEHYRPLFPECDVAGLDYRSQTPWEARDEFRRFFDAFAAAHDRVTVVANSIGAFFTMCALYDKPIERAYFISPVADMEKLITDMMTWAGVSERELEKRGEIATASGDALSWKYLSWVRKHPVSWNIPTRILYGSKDNLQSAETIKAFAGRTGAELTVMEGGEHWFHTAEQLTFLDNWISGKAARDGIR